MSKNRKRRKKSQSNEPLIVSLKELLQKEFPEPKFIIKDILPEGSLSLLTARPKAGKTYLALQMALCVALGKLFLLKETTQSPVLFLSYELNERQLYKRLSQILEHLVAPDVLETIGTKDAPLFLSFASRLIEGNVRGVEGLRLLLQELEEKGVFPKLVFIDTYVLFKLIEEDSKNLKKSIYELESEYLGELRRLCDEKGLSIVLIHHNRKKQAISGDIIEEIMGSTGIAGAVNNLLILERQTGSKEAHLKVSGHDIEEQDIELTFEKGIFRLRTVKDKEREIIELVIGYLKKRGQANQSAIREYLKLKGFKSIHEITDILEKYSQENPNFPTYWYVFSKKRDSGGRRAKIYTLEPPPELEQKELFTDDSQKRREFLERVEALIESGSISADEFPERLEEYGVYNFKTLVEKMEDIPIPILEKYVEELESHFNFAGDEDYNFDF